jgi:hypothetical protein
MLHNSPRNSTQDITEKLSQANQLEEKVSDDIADDYVIVNPEDVDLDADEYVIDGFIEFKATEAYQPEMLNQIIFRQYKKAFLYQRSVFNETTGKAVAHIFLREAQEIVLFETVKNYEDFETAKYALSLDQALEMYKMDSAYNTTQQLVIPISDLSAMHFRLLTITKDEISYYNSHNYLINLAANTFLPLLPATKTAWTQTEKIIHERIRQFETEQVSDESRAASSIPSQLGKTFFIRSAALGSFVYHAAANYFSYRDVVRDVCAKHFPAVSFNEKPLGDQTSMDHVSCGPITAAYAECVSQGLAPKVTETLLEVRAKQGTPYRPKPESDDDEGLDQYYNEYKTPSLSSRS